MDLSSLSTLQKLSKKSFNDQRSLIKGVLAGKHVNCPHCGSKVSFRPKTNDAVAKVICSKGCTDIELDIS